MRAEISNSDIEGNDDWKLSRVTVSFVVALLKNLVNNDILKKTKDFLYPTIRGTAANLPSIMDLVGKSVMILPSTTGRNFLYPEAVLQKCVSQRACCPTEHSLQCYSGILSPGKCTDTRFTQTRQLFNYRPGTTSRLVCVEIEQRLSKNN